jgi:hypothetical protein
LNLNHVLSAITREKEIDGPVDFDIVLVRLGQAWSFLHQLVVLQSLSTTFLINPSNGEGLWEADIPDVLIRKGDNTSGWWEDAAPDLES